ncbi:hypothetical protein F6Y24_16780 [Xanthomonas arboricola pv. pruni]|nr:hypothetical protein F6Y24_16780 [Xanthomonas arboricola pv. pruni]
MGAWLFSGRSKPKQLAARLRRKVLEFRPRRPDHKDHGTTAASDPQAAATAVAMHTDHHDWSLPAHRRGTLRGMDAA